VQLAESDRSAHDPMAKGGDAPAARTGNLRNQPVDVKAVEEAGDLGTLLGRVLTKMAVELGSEVAIREPVHRVLSAQEGDEELGIGPGHRIEGLNGPARRRVLGLSSVG